MSWARAVRVSRVVEGRAPRGWVVLALVLVVGLFWWTHIVPGDGLALGNGDVLNYFYPSYETIARSLRDGRLPLWNPYQLCGTPWLATMQGGFFYPPHAVYLVLPTYRGIALLGIAHLLLLAIGTACFARRAGIGAAGAVLAGILVTTRGRVPESVMWPNTLEAFAWLPIGCLGVLDLVGGPRRRGIALLASAVGFSFLAGYPQTTVYALYAWASLAAVSILLRPRTWAWAGASFAAAVVLGGMLAAAQLLPTRELTSVGVRATQALTLNQMYPVGGPFVAFFGYLQLVHDALSGSQTSFGVIGLALVAGALLAARARAVGWWAVGFGIAALVFAMGPVTRVFQAALYLPALAWFRVPPRALVFVDFCFALAAGAGLHALTAEPKPWPARVVPIATSGVLAAVAWMRAEIAAFWLALAGSGTWTLALFAGTLRPALGVLVVGLAVLEVFSMPTRGLLLPYDAGTAAAYDEEREAYAGIAELVGHDRFWLTASGMRTMQASPKQATRFRVRAIDDYEPLHLERQAQYLTYLVRGQVTSHIGSATFLGTWPLGDVAKTGPGIAARRRLLDLAAVRVFAVPALMTLSKAARDLVLQAGFDEPRRLGSIVAYRNPHVLPRAFVTYRTRPAPPAEELLPQLADPAFDPLHASFVEGAAPFVPAPNAPERGAPAAFVRDDATDVELDATLAAPGLVVLADTAFDGWSATIDGTPAPIVVTNHLFRGVPAPAGRHRVRFAYRPWRVPVGIATSLVALLVITGMLVVPARRAPRQ